MNERKPPIRKHQVEALQKQLQAALTPDVAMNAMRTDRDMLQTRCDILADQLAEKDVRIAEIKREVADLRQLVETARVLSLCYPGLVPTKGVN